MVQRKEVVDVEAPAAANLCGDRHVRERLEARVGRVPRAYLSRELLARRGHFGVVVNHLDGFGYGTELLDHVLPQLGGELGLRNAWRHGVLLGGCLSGMKTP